MKIHTFDNGVRVYDRHLLDVQKSRYEKCNVHEEDEEDIFIEIIKSMPDSGCYVSIGTAIGYYPLLAKKIRPDISIHCFEPLPRHLDYFNENMKINGFTVNDFHVYGMAISTKSSGMYLKDASYGSHVTGDSHDNTAIGIEAIALRDIFELISNQRVDFLQMDIQGHEEAVLASYFSSPLPSHGVIESFLVGTHGDLIHKKCRNIFLDHGYVLKMDEPHTLNQPDGILCCHSRH